MPHISLKHIYQNFSLPGSSPVLLLLASQALKESMPELEILRYGDSHERRRNVCDLCNIDDDVARGVDPQHEMVEPGEVLSPGWPVQNCTILEHLNIRWD